MQQNFHTEGSRVPYKVGNSINTIANFVKLRRPFDIFTKKLFCNILVSNHHGQKHNDEEEAAGAHFNVCWWLLTDASSETDEEDV